jgi:hypothetical protein
VIAEGPAGDAVQMAALVLIGQGQVGDPDDFHSRTSSRQSASPLAPAETRVSMPIVAGRGRFPPCSGAGW